jgi:hypothetical protein
LTAIGVSDLESAGFATARVRSAAELVAAERAALERADDPERAADERAEDPERLALEPLRRVVRDADGALAARAEVDLRWVGLRAAVFAVAGLRAAVLARVPEVCLESVAVAIGCPIWSRLNRGYPTVSDR